MTIPYERIEHQEPLPIRVYLHKVRRTDYHLHHDMEFLFAVQGSVIVQSGGREARLRQGDVFFIHSGEIHLTHETDEPNLLLALQVDLSFAQRSDPDFVRRVFQVDRLGKPDAVRAILAQIMWEMHFKPFGYAFKVQALLHELLLILLRATPSTLVDSPTHHALAEETAEFGPRLGRIAAYVEAHFQEDLSITALAQREGVSVGYLARLFKSRTGRTCGEYLSLVRVTHSLKELADAHRLIAQIALDCGFPNVKARQVDHAFAGGRRDPDTLGSWQNAGHGAADPRSGWPAESGQHLGKLVGAERLRDGHAHPQRLEHRRGRYGAALHAERADQAKVNPPRPSPEVSL